MSNDLAIGLDLGGTQVRAALVQSGSIIRRSAERTDVAGGPAAVMAQFDRLIGDVCCAPERKAVTNVGVCSAGPLDTETGTILRIPTLPGWDGYPLRSALSTRLELPVVLENDGIAAAFGEWKHGAGRGLQHLVYVTVSTGVGGGVVVDGRLLHGRRGMASHVGHLRMALDGPVCACGATGCFEAFAAGTALGKRARRTAERNAGGYLGKAAQTRVVDSSDVVDGARTGDRECLALLAEEADYLGMGFTSLIHLFSPQRIIMGGGVSHAFDLLAEGIGARIRSDAMEAFRDVEVVPAELGDNSGLIGAASLALWSRAETTPPG